MYRHYTFRNITAGNYFFLARAFINVALIIIMKAGVTLNPKVAGRAQGVPTLSAAKRFTGTLFRTHTRVASAPNGVEARLTRGVPTDARDAPTVAPAARSETGKTRKAREKSVLLARDVPIDARDAPTVAPAARSETEKTRKAREKSEDAAAKKLAKKAMAPQFTRTISRAQQRLADATIVCTYNQRKLGNMWRDYEEAQVTNIADTRQPGEGKKKITRGR